MTDVERTVAGGPPVALPRTARRRRYAGRPGGQA